MKKRIVWLIAVATAFGSLAEVVITSPTGSPDESDVVLEKGVASVKELPTDAVAAIGDVVSYTSDEIRTTTHGVKSILSGATPREVVRETMLDDVTAAWNASDDILMRTYSVSSVVGKEIAGANAIAAPTVDVRPFFKGVDFPEGATAYYRPANRRLVVFNNASSLQAIEDILSRYHRVERDYKQVEINAKFIEVSQSTLNQLGFTWRIEDTGGITGLGLIDDWQLDAPQDLLAAGIRGAVGAFGGATGAGSMVFTKSGWMPLSLTIDALEQASDSDVLSSPTLTTKDGKTAEIWVGEDRQVPGRFNVNSDDSSVRVEHAAWDSQLMGVHFKVKPKIRENNTIRLELSPKIVDLIGYDTYQVSPNASMMVYNGLAASTVRVQGRFPITKYVSGEVTDVWQSMSTTLASVYGAAFSDPNYFHNDDTDNPEDDALEWNNSSPTVGYFNQWRSADHETFGVPLASVQGRLPYFRIREIETQVDVADGSTVGLGGLIYDRLETYKDKVPVLGSIPLIGRLFRSEGERSIKRNLMIFVTATQVEDNGQRKSDLVINN